MGSSRQEEWSGLPRPSPGDLPDPGIEATALAWQAGSLLLAPPGKSLLSIPIPYFNYLSFHPQCIKRSWKKTVFSISDP